VEVLCEGGSSGDTLGVRESGLEKLEVCLCSSSAPQSLLQPG